MTAKAVLGNTCIFGSWKFDFPAKYNPSHKYNVLRESCPNMKLGWVVFGFFFILPIVKCTLLLNNTDVFMQKDASMISLSALTIGIVQCHWTFHHYRFPLLNPWKYICYPPGGDSVGTQACQKRGNKPLSVQISPVPNSLNTFKNISVKIINTHHSYNPNMKLHSGQMQFPQLSEATDRAFSNPLPFE